MFLPSKLAGFSTSFSTTGWCLRDIQCWSALIQKNFTSVQWYSLPENLWTELIQIWTVLKKKFFRTKNQPWTALFWRWFRLKQSSTALVVQKNPIFYRYYYLSQNYVKTQNHTKANKRKTSYFHIQKLTTCLGWMQIHTSCWVYFLLLENKITSLAQWTSLFERVCLGAKKGIYGLMLWIKKYIYTLQQW